MYLLCTEGIPRAWLYAVVYLGNRFEYNCDLSSLHRYILAPVTSTYIYAIKYTTLSIHYGLVTFTYVSPSHDIIMNYLKWICD